MNSPLILLGKSPQAQTASPQLYGADATGKKVNSALDNPTNFFTAQGLDNRARFLFGIAPSCTFTPRNLPVLLNRTLTADDLVVVA